MWNWPACGKSWRPQLDACSFETLGWRAADPCLLWQGFIGGLWLDGCFLASSTGRRFDRLRLRFER